MDPVYRSLFQQMGIAIQRSPYSQVRHEVCINKYIYQGWFAHKREEQVREIFRLSSIKVSPVPFNYLEILISRNLCIELDGGGSYLL